MMRLEITEGYLLKVLVFFFLQFYQGYVVLEVLLFFVFFHFSGV